MVRITCIATVVALSSLAATAHAQDWRLPASYGSGTLTLGSGGSITVDLEAGGDRDAWRSIGGNCVGIVANAPDYRVFVEGSGPGTLSFAATSTSDTTLVVRGPTGEFHCDDDSGGNLNPLVSNVRGTPGQYDIWVGTFSQSGFYPPARLVVTAEGRAAPAPEPVARASRYYFAENNQPVGPLGLGDLQAAIGDGRIGRTTLVWVEGTADWVAAESLAELAELFPPPPPPLPEPPPLPPPLPPAN